MAEGWNEVFQESSNKFYYWKPGTNDVNWCIPESKWRKFKEPKSGKIYYCHAESGKTVWKLPEGVVVPESKGRGSVSAAPPTPTGSQKMEIPEPPASPLGKIEENSDFPPQSDESSSQENSSEQPPKQESSDTEKPKETQSEKPKEQTEKPQEYSERPTALSLSEVDDKSLGNKGDRTFSVVHASAGVKDFPDSLNPEAIAAKVKGNSHFNQKEFNEAKECYDNAIKLDPTNANFYFNRSATYYCLGDIDKALIDARKAAEYAPDSASALTRLGFTLMKVTPPKYDEAEDMYERALKLDPTSTRIAKGLARVKQLKTESQN